MSSGEFGSFNIPKSETCRCCKSNIDPPHAPLVRIWRVATGWCTLATMVVLGGAIFEVISLGLSIWFQRKSNLKQSNGSFFEDYPMFFSLYHIFWVVTWPVQKEIPEKMTRPETICGFHGATVLDPYQWEKRDSCWSCIYSGTVKTIHPLKSVFHLQNRTFTAGFVYWRVETPKRRRDDNKTCRQTYYDCIY